MGPLDHHGALIFTMMLVSAADQDMTDQEMMEIGALVRSLPVFRDFDEERLVPIAEDCAARLLADDGFDRVWAAIMDGLPKHLHETAYAVACLVAAADGNVRQEEREFLQFMRHHLPLDRLIASGIERGARALSARA